MVRMATLNWIGKEAVVNHDKEVPFKLLKKVPSASVGKESKNLIVHGDNLEALKALMPFYKGKVKCIYIDPPYNTGNEGWVYNDKVNSPKIREWLGKIVGPEAQDLTRHDKWLCMMYPRLVLLRDLLSEDGVMFISIDDNEQHNLRLIMEEIMPGSFVTTLHVQMSTVQGQKVRSAKQGNIVKNAEYVQIYAKDKKKNIGQKPLYDIAAYDSHYSLFLEEAANGFKIVNLGDIILRDEGVARQLKELGLIKNLKAPKITGGSIAEAYTASALFRDFIHKNAPRIARYHDTAEVDEDTLDIKKVAVTNGRAVRYSAKSRDYLITKDTKGAYKQLITLDEKIRMADDFNGTLGVTTIRGDWWPGFYLDMGNVSKEGDTEYKNGKKPIRLIKQLIKFSTKDNDLILDSFAGSGSTGHAVMDLNAEEKSKRNFILVEMEDHVAEDVTAGRIKKSIEKHSYKEDFEFCNLDKPLFDAKGQIDESCSYEDLATYIYFTETQTNLEKKTIKKPFIGESHGTSYYLIYAGKDKNDLTRATIEKLKLTGPAVIYADRCLVDEDELEEKGIVFKQIPYEIKVY